jgi:hypothetical protein
MSFIFTNFYYSEKRGAISFDYSSNAAKISQVYINENSFYETEAKYGGAIYYDVPKGGEIQRGCFVETIAESGRAIYFTGGKDNDNTILFGLNHAHKSQTPFGDEGEQGDATLSGNLDFSTKYAYDFQIYNYTKCDETETEGPGYAVHISIQTRISFNSYSMSISTCYQVTINLYSYTSKFSRW